jgi:predicted metal-dependent hydrolase
MGVERDAEIAAFMHEKRRWVYDKREEMQERIIERPFPTRFATGGKVQYRGRRLRLVVELADVGAPTIEFRNAFRVRVPANLDDPDRDRAVERALRSWMKEHVGDDANAFVRCYGAKLGVAPKGVRVKDQRHLWGSCSKDGVINLNWQLVFAPKAVLEYVVVHELCHLRHRDHSPAFWRAVKRVLPEYKREHEWLARHAGWEL